MSGLASSSLVSATRRFSPPDSFVTSASPGGQRSASSACSTWVSRSHRLLRVDLVLQLGHLVGGLVRVVGGDLVVAVEQRLLLRHALHGVAEHVLRGIELRLLRQVADLDAVGRPGLADEVLDLAGHDLEQRRLARAVQADDADLGAGEERQRDVLQDLLAARIGLGELVHVIDVLWVRHQRRLLLESVRSWGVFYPPLPSLTMCSRFVAGRTMPVDAGWLALVEALGSLHAARAPQIELGCRQRARNSPCSGAAFARRSQPCPSCHRPTRTIWLARSRAESYRVASWFRSRW